jgi:hypothetical protein
MARLPRGTEVKGWETAADITHARGSGRDWNSFDEYGFRQLFADAEPRVANLADEIARARNQLDRSLITGSVESFLMHTTAPVRTWLRGHKATPAHWPSRIVYCSGFFTVLKL